MPAKKSFDGDAMVAWTATVQATVTCGYHKSYVVSLGVMKRSVKTDVDSVDGRHPRSTVDQTELFYWSTLTRLSFSTGLRQQVENLSLVGI